MFQTNLSMAVSYSFSKIVDRVAPGHANLLSPPFHLLLTSSLFTAQLLFTPCSTPSYHLLTSCSYPARCSPRTHLLLTAYSSPPESTTSPLHLILNSCSPPAHLLLTCQENFMFQKEVCLLLTCQENFMFQKEVCLLLTCQENFMFQKEVCLLLTCQENFMFQKEVCLLLTCQENFMFQKEVCLLLTSCSPPAHLLLTSCSPARRASCSRMRTPPPWRRAGLPPELRRPKRSL
jgi:hypothetical protein